MSIVQNSAQKSRWYLPGVIGGLGITMKHLLKNLISKKSMQTINYPEEKYEYGPRFKGNHILTVKKDGSLRCTACMLCATNCPAECIKITASENPDPKVEKFPISYEIDILRCVFCGFCEEACPIDAIRLGPEWQTPGLSGSNFTYDINHLAYRPDSARATISLGVIGTFLGEFSQQTITVETGLNDHAAIVKAAPKLRQHFCPFLSVDRNRPPGCYFR